MAIQLTDAQADLIAEAIAWKIGGIMESASDWDADPILEALREVDPLRSAVEELREHRSSGALELLAEVAAEVLGDHSTSAGNALATIHQVEAGRVVEFRCGNETPQEIITRERKEAEDSAEKAALAQAVVWAVRRQEAEEKAAEGDPLAREHLACQERWDEENRQFAEAT